MITLPVALKRHSPFFTCVVTMSSVVHLAYWSFFVPDGEDGLVKEQIRLNVGALKTFGEMWADRQVRAVSGPGSGAGDVRVQEEGVP